MLIQFLCTLRYSFCKFAVLRQEYQNILQVFSLALHDGLLFSSHQLSRLARLPVQ